MADRKYKNQSATTGTNNYEIAKELNPETDQEIATEFPRNVTEKGTNKKQQQSKKE